MKTTLLSSMSLLMLMIPTAYAQDSTQSQLIAKGEYLALAGDCVACHTKEGGETFAGGRPVVSPFGNIYSTNITPSKTSGIGKYTYHEFEQAVRHGVRADGAFLYPAMPYPDYQKLTDDDTKALYAYFMQGVKAVDHNVEKTDLSFPFDQRWGIRFWNWVSTDEVPFTPDKNQDSEYNRGAYLVQGLGHCGSCHTPRGWLYQEKAYKEDHGQFLAGADIGIWHAPEIRAGKDGPLSHWSSQDFVDYFSGGRNQYAAVAGEMTDVIEHSLSHLTEQDQNAIAKYLTALPSDGKGNNYQSNEGEDKTTITLNKAKVDIDSGARLYLDNCGACHFNDGQGASRVFPQLKRNTLVVADNPQGLIHVILAGSRLPSTQSAPEAIEMPGFGWRLSDSETAKLATFVRQSWGNKAPAVTDDDVKKVREQIPEDVLRKSAP